MRPFHLLSLLSLITSATLAEGQGSSALDTPLHLASNRFHFAVSGDTPPTAQPLRVHNGGKTGFTNVRVTKVTYADSARGSAWLVALPHQTSVAPDELATVGMLCVDATGLRAGTYRATAAVAASEAPQPVSITITLVVSEGSTKTGAAGGCEIPALK